MIPVACALLLAAAAAAVPHSSREALIPTSLTNGESHPENVILLDSEDRMDNLIQALRKFKREEPEDRQRFMVKYPCGEREKGCLHSQLYEFDLLSVKPDGKDSASVYY